MSFLGLFESPPKQKSRTYQGTQFEIFVEKLFRREYSDVERNVVFEIVQGRKKVYTTQVDLTCRLTGTWDWRNTYGLFELKYSNEFTINEEAVKQLLRSYYNISRRQSKIIVKPVAVVTNTDFTSGARALAEKYNVRLINRGKLEDMYDRSWFAKPTIDDAIREINVSKYRTAPIHFPIPV